MSPSGEDTPKDTNSAEAELRDMTADELRDRAAEEEVPGRSSMRKDELIEALSDADAERSGGGDNSGDGGDGSGGDDGGQSRDVTQSEDTKYSQVISSPDDEPEREGRSLVTANHEVIRNWAEERGATPATVPGTEHDDHLGVLRFDFPGYGGDDLEHVSWDEWFRTFDDRNLNFLYQEQRSDGTQSNFFRLENPDRSDG